MSTLNAGPIAGQESAWALDVSGTAPIPFSRLVKVEFRKMLDTRGGFWLLLCTLGLLVLVVGVVFLIIGLDDMATSAQDWMQILVFPLSILLPVFPILAATSEWSQRTGLVTFALVAGRTRVMAAKLVAVLALGGATFLVAVVIGALANPLGAALGGYPVQWNIDGQEMFWTLFVQLLYFLMAFGLGAAILNTPGAVAMFYVFGLLLPLMLYSFLVFSFEWAQKVIPFIDLQFGTGPLFSGVSNLSGLETAQAVVSILLWVVAPILVGLNRIHRSEIK